ncbi:tRNA pseudouridine(38-40) synthase TruA [Flavobacteriales bacterium]|jgi:tRNA pseudouridine38-40 synthase|nr:tRNA pseudouridine(38-40) synthase TruA [Flavobacteriales bacterium]MDA7578800.1 tRNA pseudouridine(38-40) synthase TruA [Flavobacteriales bacterium]MDC0909111.1 tRNA pseudouridine(38-40) synthase TruA [Flavobacteriales bacterium]MDC1069389.1 tRNA pseudouridine(38-40) synthase TruA [Flavobacteriales bacterium]MDC3390552.1 tRNA pseudouridine(38-40) synthase TruA [Flavobacteriales bacterium]
MRFFIKFSYDGTNYHGWQIQPNANSVQEEINIALSTILNTNIKVVGAGRTDAGVHADQMYAHFDFDAEIRFLELTNRLNSFLSDNIAVNEIFRVCDKANSRFDALSRTYRYKIIKTKSPFHRHAYLFKKDLNLDMMNSACLFLLGKRDFTSFSKVKTQTYTNDCTVIDAKWEEINNEIVFTIKADRFLRNMVRAIVGTLIEVGIGKIKPDNIVKIINAKDRCRSGFSVPAHALSLIKVTYPENIKIN